jgi:Sulfotransferase family
VFVTADHEASAGRDLSDVVAVERGKKSMNTEIIGRAFIIGNGRCGSTLLSELIAKQPETLAIQEFAGGGNFDEGPEEALTGAAYWNILKKPSIAMSTLFRIDAQPSEVRYPSNGRWADRLTQLPRILITTLPAISSDPDALFDSLSHRVANFPVQKMARHHLMFFDLLATMTGRRRWVERSGGSSLFAPFLLREYPTATFIHLTRGLTASARSMSRHPSFRLYDLRVEFVGACGFDPYTDRPRPDVQVPEHLQRYLPERLTADALAERGRNEERFRFLCAFKSNIAEQAFLDSPPKALLRVRYEDLVAEPIAQLSRIGEYLEFDDWRDWAARAAPGVVDPRNRKEGGTGR